MKQEEIERFIESQRRISKIKSVANEKEVRLIEVEGKSKKSKNRSSNEKKTSTDSNANTTIKQKPKKKDKLELVQEVEPDNEVSKLLFYIEIQLT